MKTEGLEKQTLTLLVFSANVIVGAIARQIVLHYGLDAFNGYVAFVVCILVLTAIYINLQTLFRQVLSPYIEKLFSKISSYRGKTMSMSENKEKPTEKGVAIEETDVSPPPSPDYEQIRQSAIKAQERIEQEKLATVLTYTRESFAPYMREDDLNLLCKYISLFHTDKNVPRIPLSIKVDSTI